jgi:Na+-driven multidrug efflux pump
MDLGLYGAALATGIPISSFLLFFYFIYKTKDASEGF